MRCCRTCHMSSSRSVPQPCLPSPYSRRHMASPLAVRAGASGRVYRWAIAAVSVIGAGAFMLSFRALRDLLIQTGTPPAWAWIFPAIIDTAVGVATMMLVALGDKPARRTRPVAAPGSPQVKASAPIAPEPVSALPRPRTTVASAPDQHADAGADHAA